MKVVAWALALSLGALLTVPLALVLFVTLVLVVNSWLPLTASVDVPLRVAGATLVILVPAAPPPSVMLVFAAES